MNSCIFWKRKDLILACAFQPPIAGSSAIHHHCIREFTAGNFFQLFCEDFSVRLTDTFISQTSWCCSRPADISRGLTWVAALRFCRTGSPLGWPRAGSAAGGRRISGVKLSFVPKMSALQTATSSFIWKSFGTMLVINWLLSFCCWD